MPSGFKLSTFPWNNVIQTTLTSGKGHSQSSPKPKKMRMQLTEELFPRLHL